LTLLTGFTITTSWDDGHPLDQRIADLLDRHGLTGTFYVPRHSQRPRLPDADLREMAVRHEVGAHTLNHAVLAGLDEATAREEIAGSRHWLEDTLGRPVTTFCYPRGAYDDQARRLVAEAGFSLARTVEAFRFTVGSDPFIVPTTLHLYPYPLRPSSSLRARFQPVRRALAHRRSSGLPLAALFSWERLALATLDRAAAIGGVWHLWGHSWEIDHYGLWDALDAVLGQAAAYPRVRPATNGQLTDLLKAYGS